MVGKKKLQPAANSESIAGVIYLFPKSSVSIICIFIFFKSFTYPQLPKFVDTFPDFLGFSAPRLMFHHI
jgi:hypothetical protein